MTKQYESMIILEPGLSMEEVQKENERIINLIKDNGGEVTKTDSWGKRFLAYPIQKKSEGYYLINYFSLDSLKVLQLEKFYKLNEKIIRFNLINLGE